MTDVTLDRLITRFGNALKIGNDLIHPDLFMQDASGAWVPSENFGYIFGMIQPMNAPDIFVKLGLVQQGTQMPGFQAGKIIETIALGLMSTIFSTILAIPLSFLAARNITARFPGGTVVYYVMRTFLNFVRSIDTLIWGLIVVLWVGLGSFAGVIALTIHSVAALGKLFSEEVEHIDAGPIEAITATGANLLQTIRYGVIPQIVAALPGLYTAALGYQHAVGHHRWLCGRRRHRLLRGGNDAGRVAMPIRGCPLGGGRGGHGGGLRQRQVA